MITDEMIQEIGGLELLLSEECLTDCTTTGDNTWACLEWVETMGLGLSREKCESLIKPYGAWSNNEIDQMSDMDLNAKALWIAACNVVEDTEMFN